MSLEPGGLSDRFSSVAASGHISARARRAAARRSATRAAARKAATGGAVSGIAVPVSGLNREGLGVEFVCFQSPSGRLRTHVHLVPGLLDKVRGKVLVGPIEDVVDLVAQIFGAEPKTDNLILRSFQAEVRGVTHTKGQSVNESGI